MKNFYYLIWANAILSIRKYHPEMGDWKFRTFFLFTVVQAINMWIIFIWTKYLDLHNIQLIKIDILLGSFIDNTIAFFIVFILPIGILNYLLIFYNNRFEKMLHKYEKIKTGIAGIYAISIAISSLITVILYSILT